MALCVRVQTTLNHCRFVKLAAVAAGVKIGHLKATLFVCLFFFFGGGRGELSRNFLDMNYKISGYNVGWGVVDYLLRRGVPTIFATHCTCRLESYWSHSILTLAT